MMSDLFINPRTEMQLSQLKDRLPHALILSGKKGVGLNEAVQYILELYTHFPIIISPNEKNSITVETIRTIYSQSNTKKIDKQIFILNEADKMTQSAQNALLKRLEEPIHNVHFVLLTHSPQRLLPTITSRSQSVTVLPLTREQYTKYIDSLKITDIQKKQIRYIAEGLQSETEKLLNDKAYFEQRTKQVTFAKQFLQSRVYEKLITINTISKDKQTSLQLLLDCAHIIETMLLVKPDTSLVQQLNKIMNIYENIDQDRNVRIQFLRYII